MPATLFFALCGVYLLGVAGVATVGAILGFTRDELGPLEERLAVARATVPDARRSRSRVVKSIDVQ